MVCEEVVVLMIGIDGWRCDARTRARACMRAVVVLVGCV